MTEREELFMKKKIFSLIAALSLILSSLGSLKVFAATEQQLAVFSYTAPAGTAAGAELTGNANSGYTATSGVFQADAKLFASVDGTSTKKLEWSKAEYKYGSLSTAMVPIVTASTSNPWGTKPYFEIACPTSGFENIVRKSMEQKKAPQTTSFNTALTGQAIMMYLPRQQ